jgi:hypothetical protein
MTDQTTKPVTTRTLLDIELAKLYFEVLVNLARNRPGQTITYGDLVKAAKAQNPDNPYIPAAIATNIGRRLDTVREFTNSHQLPDLSALAVNAGTGDNGVGFQRSFDGEAVRQQIAEFDWAQVRLTFDDFISQERVAFQIREEKKKRRKKISEEEAGNIWWDHYLANKAALSHITQEQKLLFIKLIMTGLTPEEVVEQVFA